MEALVFILILLLFIALGIPIGFSLIVVGAMGIYFVEGVNAFGGFLSTTPFASVNSFSLTTLPMFILMAYFIEKSRIAEDLYDCIIKWIGHVPGGVGISTVVSSAGFGALSGSSIAATTIMSKITIPQMVKVKYSESFSSGLVASSTGTLAVLIPPSIPLILYAIQTETSIGPLLVAGVFPGILLALLLSIFIFFVSLKSKIVVEKTGWSYRFSSLKNILPMVILIVVILAIIYLGIATATEAAAVGALGSLVLGLVMKRLNFKLVIESLVEATKQTAMIFTIVLGGQIFAYFMTLTGTGQQLIQLINDSGWSKYTILIMIIIFYLILGLFMDLMGSLILTLPIVFPIIMELGFDPIWFGVIVVLLLEIGLVTPPVGINLYITSKISGIPVKNVFYGSLPFIFILLLTVALIVIFPQIALYLPAQMGF